MGRQLVFIHIPRTAGTNFILGLREVFEGKVCPYSMWGQFVMADDLDSYDLLGGHTNYQIRELLAGKDPLMMTILAEPINRTLSHYRFLMRYGGHPFNNVLQKMTFEEFLFCPFWNRLVGNLQTRMIGANFERDSIKTYIDFVLSTPPTVENLFLAKERLDEFFFIGIKERFRESLVHAGKLLNLQIPLLRGKVTKYSAGLPCEFITKLEEINQLDTELYRFGSELFKERIDGDH